MTDTRPWRLYKEIHVYAVEPGGTEEPIGTVHNPHHAKQIVNEHNSEIAKVLEENDRLRADARKIADERGAAREAMARSSTAQAGLLNKNEGLIRRLGEVADERDELVSENGKLILKLNEITKESGERLHKLDVMHDVLDEMACDRAKLLAENTKLTQPVWVSGTDAEARCD